MAQTESVRAEGLKLKLSWWMSGASSYLYKRIHCFKLKNTSSFSEARKLSSKR